MKAVVTIAHCASEGYRSAIGGTVHDGPGPDQDAGIDPNYDGGMEQTKIHAASGIGRSPAVTWGKQQLLRLIEASLASYNTTPELAFPSLSVIFIYPYIILLDLLQLLILSLRSSFWYSSIVVKWSTAHIFSALSSRRPLVGKVKIDIS